MIALVYCARSDNSKKANAKKANYKLFFGQTECDSTLPGIPAEKKLHHTDGTKSPSKFIDHCKFVEEYYAGMSASDIVTCNSQFLLCIEDSVWSTSIFKRISCYILVVYDKNAFGLARTFIPSYKYKGLEG